jgi:hypothetical protein
MAEPDQGSDAGEGPPNTPAGYFGRRSLVGGTRPFNRR